MVADGWDESLWLPVVVDVVVAIVDADMVVVIHCKNSPLATQVIKKNVIDNACSILLWWVVHVSVATEDAVVAAVVTDSDDGGRRIIGGCTVSDAADVLGP